MNTDDWQLLEDYAERNSEEAFRTLVERHAPMVYHTALRHLRDPHRAEEVTQAVFIALARKAGRIPRRTILVGWLFRAVRLAVAQQARGDARRQRHEQEAILMQTISSSPETNAVWEQVAPRLDDALDQLPEADREAVLIRFFQDKSHKELALMLGVSEDAAKMRVSRAVEKLRRIFARQGLAVSSLVLVATFAACGAQAVPSGLTASVTTAAVAHGTAGAAATFTTARGILKLMTWLKLKAALTIGAGVLLAAGTTGIIVNAVGSSTANVVSQLAKQSGKTIAWDKRLSLPSSFKVNNLPFELALDELAVEAGGYWSVDYAVYGSAAELRGLLDSLHEGAQLGSAGWTNLSHQRLMPIIGVAGNGSRRGVGIGSGSPNLVMMTVVLNREATAEHDAKKAAWLKDHPQTNFAGGGGGGSFRNSEGTGTWSNSPDGGSSFQMVRRAPPAEGGNSGGGPGPGPGPGSGRNGAWSGTQNGGINVGGGGGDGSVIRGSSGFGGGPFNPFGGAGEGPDAEWKTPIINAIKDGELEGVLAPERLLAANSLIPFIQPDVPMPATPEAAAAAAAKSGAQWTTIYTLRKAPVDRAGIRLNHHGMEDLDRKLMMQSMQTRAFSLNPDERLAHERAFEEWKKSHAADKTGGSQ